MIQGAPLTLDPDRPVGFESRKSYARRCRDGFWDTFVMGPIVLDVGYRGGLPDALPILPGAIGIEPDHLNVDGKIEAWASSGPNHYDGLRLPAADQTVDTVHSSHTLEHLHAPTAYLQEWFRAVRVGGTMIVIVPNAFLYERRLTVPPSRWSPEHLRSYSPATLMATIEAALPENSYRIMALFDDDTGYDYSLPIDVHPVGCLETVCVVRKIVKPRWSVEP